MCRRPALLRGGVAQLGERLLCKQEVIGSNPFTSTTGKARLGRSTGAAAWRREQRLAKTTTAAATAAGLLIDG